MSPPSTTKERIFDAAEAIMLEKSFHSVGLNEILKAVQVPKGSFYHHFESKDQFGIEMLRHYVDAATAYKKRMLLSDELEADPRQRMLTFFESSIAKFMENEGKCPCLVIKLASEVTDLNDGMRQVLADGYKEWNRITATLIAEGLGKNSLRCDLDPSNAASLIGDLWTGAVQHAAIRRSAEPLRTTLAFISQNLILPPR